MNIADRIMVGLKRRNISPHALEIALGYGNGAIKKFANHPPSIAKVIEVAKYLDMSVEYIAIGDVPDDTPFDLSKYCLVDTNDARHTDAFLQRSLSAYEQELFAVLKTLDSAGQAAVLQTAYEQQIRMKIQSAASIINTESDDADIAAEIRAVTSPSDDEQAK